MTLNKLPEDNVSLVLRKWEKNKHTQKKNGKISRFRIDKFVLRSEKKKTKQILTLLST